MSTFDGVVEEFPDIRIDYFRHSSSQSRSPLAYFLSHVHSDHLAGLESCKSPFIYCSPATRDIILRLEKYPHRMNFAKGILERRTQTYRHLKTLLKAIPLETPTAIELSPGKDVQVTLFDANHCVGAVMFLIEGGGKAVLYTGDIRSELWWVNSLTRHPLLIPYVSNSESGGSLDCMYLDTTFVVTGREDPYRHFPSKAEGIQELLQKVAQYPSDTLFYFDSWTFGYEDVWQALSTFLGSRIHVDDYRYKLYLALANGTEPKAPESQKLIGFNFGNRFQQGCLDFNQCRIHSCEKGTNCEIWQKDFVRITPIISRHNGVEMAELGAGGGQGDLNQQAELEVGDAQIVGQLMALCASKLQGQTQMLSGVLQMLTSVINDGVQSIALNDALPEVRTAMSESQHEIEDLDEMPLEKLVPALARIVTTMKLKQAQTSDSKKTRPALELTTRADELSKQITFPYSRHSSYNELCQLIKAFKPKDIHPCTVEETNWTPASSMSFLFGHIYESSVLFRHDQRMLKKRGLKSDEQLLREKPGSAGSTGSTSSSYATPHGHSPQLKPRQPTASTVVQPPVPPQNTVRMSQRPITSRGAPGRDAPLVQQAEWQAQFKRLFNRMPEPTETPPSLSGRRSSPKLRTQDKTALHRLDADSMPPKEHRKYHRVHSSDDLNESRPPVNVNHYSPSRDRRRSLRSSSPPFKSRRSSDNQGKVDWPRPSPVDVASDHRLHDRWQERIAEANSEQNRDYTCGNSMKRRRSRETPEYGRLSPPPVYQQDVVDGAAIQDRFTKLFRRQRAQDADDLPQKKLQNGNNPTSLVQSRMAHRREAYNAALGSEGYEWSDVDLVSVNGHQIKEEEL